MAITFTYPPVGGATTPNASVGTNGATSPTSSTLVAGQNPSGLQQPLQTNAAKSLIVVTEAGSVQHVIVDSSALPTGASTSALQTSGNASLTSIDAKTPALVSGNVPVTGPLTDVQLRASAVPVSGTFYQGTQPVSAAALPLPAGASTSALQTSGNVSLTSIDAKTPALGQALAASSVPVVLTAAQLTTLTPPTTVTANIGTTNGLALDASLSTLNASVNTLLKPASTLATVTTVGTVTTVSAVTAITNALPTGSNVIGAVKQAGKVSANAPVRNDYTSVNVTTGAYVQLVASTTSAATEIEIFDSSGQTLALAFGAAASEVNQIYIFPGGNGRVALSVPAGTRVSVKAVSATASVGEININFYG